MRWMEIVESQSQWYPAEQILSVYPELRQTGDLQKSVKWMSGASLDSCEISISIQSIEVFRKQIDEMTASYTAFPKDRARMKKIMQDIKDGARALPVFVEADDEHMFIIEGRHRVVAFDQLKMKKVIVASLRVKSQD